MFREDRFLISRRLYAVDLDSLRTGDGDATLDAVWFRRKNGITAACTGRLWDIQRPEPADVAEFLARLDDGRYGGTCHGRWDGASYWGNVTLAEQERHLAVLRPMLANYPAIPGGHDGWWRF